MSPSRHSTINLTRVPSFTVANHSVCSEGRSPACCAMTLSASSVCNRITGAVSICEYACQMHIDTRMHTTSLWTTCVFQWNFRWDRRTHTDTHTHNVVHDPDKADCMIQINFDRSSLIPPQCSNCDSDSDHDWPWQTTPLERLHTTVTVHRQAAALLPRSFCGWEVAEAVCV
jgi:hypothetical protein